MVLRKQLHSSKRCLDRHFSLEGSILRENIFSCFFSVVFYSLLCKHIKKNMFWCICIYCGAHGVVKFAKHCDADLSSLIDSVNSGGRLLIVGRGGPFCGIAVTLSCLQCSWNVPVRSRLLVPMLTVPHTFHEWLSCLTKTSFCTAAHLHIGCHSNVLTLVVIPCYSLLRYPLVI